MPQPAVTTCLWFDSDAEAAAQFYVSLFPGARIVHIHRQIGADEPLGPAFLVEFELQGQRYAAMNGGPHYRLSPAVSIQVFVETQGEVDRLWEALLDGGTESRCGWITDRYGLSWQIIPNALPRLIAGGGDRAARVLQAMSGMVKLDIAALETAAG